MCFEARRRFVPEIASAHVHCDETHIIRFVSTSRTRIRQLRIDWLKSVRDIVVVLLRMRSCIIRPLSFRSWHIEDGGSLYYKYFLLQNVETNRMRCVSSLGDASFPRYLRFTSAHARKQTSPQPPGRELKCERVVGSENGFQIWIADDVSIPKMTSQKFLVPTPPAESQKCVYRERKLGLENVFQI